MKGNFLCISMMLLLCHSASAKGDQTIYGFSAAADYHGKENKHGFQIQANSYVNPNNAKSYQTWLKTKTHYPVQIITKKNRHRTLYAVVVRPIPSSAALRHTGQMLSSSTGKTVQYHMKNAKQRANIKPSCPILIEPIPHTSLQSSPKTHYNPLQSLLVGSPDDRWFVAFGAGQQFPTMHSQMEILNGSNYPSPYNYDLYTTQSQNNNALIAISGGRRWQRDTSFSPAFSASVLWQYAFNNNIGKTITQYNDPQFLNYNYRWQARSNTILANGKLNVFQYKRLSPYVDVGIGATFNDANRFSESALPGVTPRVSPGFQDHINTQFSYIAGIGLDYQLTEKILLSGGYQYQNFGQISSGYGVSTWSGEKLSLGNYQASAYLVQLTYLFNNPNSIYVHSYEK